MKTARLFWESYCDLYDYLVEWTAQHVPQHDAEGIARRALAELARLSWVGYQTLNGPLADLVSSCAVRLVGTGVMGPHDGTNIVMAGVKAPSETTLRGICGMYAVSYEMCYRAGWTLMERDKLYQHLRVIRPVRIPDEAERILDVVPDDLVPVLRRALAFEGEFMSQETVCGQVAQSIYDEEIIKSLFWLRSGTR